MSTQPIYKLGDGPVQSEHDANVQLKRRAAMEMFRRKFGPSIRNLIAHAPTPEALQEILSVALQHASGATDTTRRRWKQAAEARLAELTQNKTTPCHHSTPLPCPGT